MRVAVGTRVSRIVIAKELLGVDDVSARIGGDGPAQRSKASKSSRAHRIRPIQLSL